MSADLSGTAITEQRVEPRGSGLDISLKLSQGAPFRIALYDAPPRLAVELDGPIQQSASQGPFAIQPRDEGGVRLIARLPAPMAVDRAAMSVPPGGGATLQLRMRRVGSADFAALVAPAPVPETAPMAGPVRRLTVVLDPGHGGYDPGAIFGSLYESDLVLAFAREFKEDLLRTTDFDVVLTRVDDRFVPLHERLAIARRAGADVFLSLHADGIDRGSASGATVFFHTDRRARPATEVMAYAHRREELLQGVNLTGQGDAVAVALMELARQDTAHRSRALADALLGAMAVGAVPLYKNPKQSADFVVLRAPDMPSALVELGFLSEAEDRERLVDPAWRVQVAAALRRGLLEWSGSDAALAALRLR